MTTLNPKTNEQFERFFTALFLPNELIELRFIESWLSHGKRKNRVVRPARWVRRCDLVSLHGALTAFAKRTRANVYFGVCPRHREGDADDHSIQTIRCVWCDIDHVTAEEAHRRWMAAGIPNPSIIVNSGTGIHGYWLLDHDLTSRQQRSQLEAMLPSFYRSFGGDHVQNLSRVMRPPGTVNYKDARNGRGPLPCTLCACDPERRFVLAAFSPWMARAEEERLRQLPNDPLRSATQVSAEGVLSRCAEAASLVSHLETPSQDRSRRDFAIVCDLLRLGLCREEIWSLVSGRSKFESNGRRYFDLTITNAERSVLLHSTSAEQTRAST